MFTAFLAAIPRIVQIVGTLLEVAKQVHEILVAYPELTGLVAKPSEWKDLTGEDEIPF